MATRVRSSIYAVHKWIIVSVHVVTTLSDMASYDKTEFNILPCERNTNTKDAKRYNVTKTQK